MVAGVAVTDCEGAFELSGDGVPAEGMTRLIAADEVPEGEEEAAA